MNKLKSILVAIWADIVNTYERIKIYLLGILAIVAVVEWRKIKEALLAYSANKEMASDQKKDQGLAQKEKANETKADALVKEAQELPSQEKPVTEDWYKDQK